MSQLNRHQEALCHAKRAVQISQYMVNDLMEMCELLDQKVQKAKKRELLAQEVMQNGGTKDLKKLKVLFPDDTD